MNVKEIMASVVHMVQPEDDLATAAGMMKEFDIGCVVVGSEDGLVGIVTDRDLVIRGLAAGADAASMSVAEVMTRDPMFCSVDDTVRQAAMIMEHNQVRRLPVLDADRKVVGVVSLGDICTHAPMNLSAELIESVSKPAHHEIVETT